MGPRADGAISGRVPSSGYLMKLAARVMLLVVALLLTFLAYDAARSTNAFRRARLIKIGDTREQVRETMGRPSDITHGIFGGSEAWAYGGWVNWNRLWLRPVRFRLFSPEKDEVAIEFDGDGKVREVVIPGAGEK